MVAGVDDDWQARICLISNQIRGSFTIHTVELTWLRNLTSEISKPFYRAFSIFVFYIEETVILVKIICRLLKVADQSKLENRSTALYEEYRALWWGRGWSLIWLVTNGFAFTRRLDSLRLTVGIT